MTTFLIGLAILIIGGFLYGSFVERIFKPDDRQTPAVKLEDGVDYVPMSKWKNALINLLNIAGTGPIFGPIQGILFGPVAFLTIPIGCVISGAVHDYLSGIGIENRIVKNADDAQKINLDEINFEYYNTLMKTVEKTKNWIGDKIVEK